jgi:hypothetical protein
VFGMTDFISARFNLARDRKGVWITLDCFIGFWYTIRMNIKSFFAGAFQFTLGFVAIVAVSAAVTFAVEHVASQSQDDAVAASAAAELE